MTDEPRALVRSMLPRYGRLPRQLLRDPSLPDRAIRLFGLLDDYADADGKAFPSRAVLADSMGCSTDSVDRAVRALEDAGWIIRDVRRRADRTYESTLYTLLLTPLKPVDKAVDGAADNPSRGSRTGAATSRTGAEGVAAPVRTEGTPEKELPPVSPPRGRARAVRDVPDDDPAWSQFWAKWPRKVGKGAARKAWARAIGKADAETILAEAAKFVGTVEELRFCPHPSTWLNQERWGDTVAQTIEQVHRRPRVRSSDDECPKHRGMGYHRDACLGCATAHLDDR